MSPSTKSANCLYTYRPLCRLVDLKIDARNIQLFRERLSEKVRPTIPKGNVGSFEFTVLQWNLKEWHERPWTYVCAWSLRVLKESNKNRFNSYSARNSVLITGVFFAWACATAEQAMCMEAHHRVCLHQNGASQSYHSDYFARLSWRMCSWFNKMCSLCSLQKKL